MPLDARPIILASLFLLTGCTIPQQPIPPTPYPENNDFAAPTSDCLGITAEIVQSACGSGPLMRTVSSMHNGYVCTYYARAPEEFIEAEENWKEGDEWLPFGLRMEAGEWVLGEQATLAYFTDTSDIETLKSERPEVGDADEVGDFENGFWTMDYEELSDGRVKEGPALWMKNGSLSIQISGTWVDYGYPGYGLPKERECSLDELLVLKDQLAGKPPGEVLTIPVDNETIYEPPEFALNETPPEDCCSIAVIEVEGEAEVGHLKKNWTTLKRGDVLQVGDTIVTGEDGQVAVGFLYCTKSVNGSRLGDSVLLVRNSTLATILSVGGEHVEVFIDPGISHVSVKQLAQFQTDFQVSTPRLVCSVRG
jgi:hypothetical protein